MTDIEKLELLIGAEQSLKTKLEHAKFLNKVASRIVATDKYLTLLRIAFLNGIPSDRMKDMVVTRNGIHLKGNKENG